MTLITGSWVLDGLSLLTAFIVILLSWIKYSQTYWQRKGLENPPTTFPLGNTKGLFTQEESNADFALKSYNYLKQRNQRHGGVYIIYMAMYVPVDLEIVKHIMQTDFNNFVDRGVYFDEEVDPLSAHLFSLEGQKWRSLRAKLTPTFTSGKMKMMFDTLVASGNELKLEMNRNADKEPIDIKDMLGRFTTDVIGNCAFGIDCNSIKNPDNDFRRYLQTFFVDSFWENIIGFITFVAPSLAKKLKLKIVKPELSKFFINVVKKTIQYRESNNIYRKDFMHLLLQLKNRGKLVDDTSILKDNNSKTELALTENEIAAQAFVFFLAGFETSSTTMTFCLFELASNPDIQEKLRKEVEEVLSKHGNLTYDAIMEMHYMEQVINETLRKYPPLPLLNRICTKDYKVPGTNLVLKKGTPVIIPVVGIHHDPQYYPNPDKFDPERFSEENKRKHPAYSFLPFGEGPRVCIGLRFGMMQTKVGISVLLKNYKFSINSKTSLPLKMDPKSFIMSTEGGIWLDYAKL